MNELSVRDARRLVLDAQGLLRPASFGRGKRGARDVIDRLGYVQIDTISVVERAHHHVLRTRVPNFDSAMLDRLQRTDREVFEYWSHAAAYLPMADFRYFQPMMEGWHRTRDVDRKLADRIIDRIRVDGPVQSRDFDAPDDHQSGGWWHWKPAKQVLEHLFLSGRIMVSHRDGFQKVFDLPENIVPDHVDTSPPSDSEFAHYFVGKWANAIGIGTQWDLTYPAATIQRFMKRKVPVRRDFVRAIDELVEEGELVPVMVAGEQHFASRDALSRLPLRLGRKRVTLLSPFDNLVINRRRLSTLFDFEYQIECYVPAPKREYGYFCLPILYGDELIGRMDPKAHRARGVLEIKSLHLEPGVDLNDSRLRDALDIAISNLAAANGCSEVRSGVDGETAR